MNAEPRFNDDISMLWLSPAAPNAVLVLAHGAGAGMSHKSMEAVATGLAERGIATLRFNFPYMERGSKRPDSPPVAHAAVRLAVAEASEIAPGVRLFAGGKSFGGRMTSQAQAIEPLPNVLGLVFFGFPLHPAGKPGSDRADHLTNVELPMLFLQGTRDSLAELDLLEVVVEDLRPRASLVLAEGADHSFHVPAKSGRTDAKVLDEILDSAREWMLNQA
jgi:predicted alpha/beta-hydrolase family hydrolase